MCNAQILLFSATSVVNKDEYYLQHYS